jgi:two-component system phosphate regulon sensor histidine kinase PhoR
LPFRPAIALALAAPALLLLGAFAALGWIVPTAVAPGAAFALVAGAGLAWLVGAKQARRDRDYRQAARELEARIADLEESARTAATIFELLPVAVLILDGRRHVTRASAAARALLGADPAGRALTEVLRHPAVIEAVEETLNHGAGRGAEFVLPGTIERHLAARIEMLPSEAGPSEVGPSEAGAAVMIALHDLTEIARGQRARSDFIANVSHELRTPLSSLIGFIETLQGPAHDDAPARARFLGIMHEQAARMARIVADLLSLSRIEMNEHSPPTGRVELASLVGGVADALQMKAGEKGVRLDLALARDLPAVTGDGDELAQVFQNLLDNAIKYASPGTTVRVTAERSGRQVAITVADQGEGIAREHLPRLTERFYRVDTARSRDLGGTGLGLAIVKHIVNRHRGRLAIESTPGIGSKFTVLLNIY